MDFVLGLICGYLTAVLVLERFYLRPPIARTIARVKHAITTNYYYVHYHLWLFVTLGVVGLWLLLDLYWLVLALPAVRKP